jgi:hypothetical protein
MRYQLTDAYVKSWSTGGTAEGDTFEFDLTNGDPEPQPVGLLLPAVQAAREPARSTVDSDPPTVSLSLNYEPIGPNYDSGAEVDDFLF